MSKAMMRMSEIRAQISPYSIAVTPDWSASNRLNVLTFRTLWFRCYVALWMIKIAIHETGKLKFDRPARKLALE